MTAPSRATSRLALLAGPGGALAGAALLGACGGAGPAGGGDAGAQQRPGAQRLQDQKVTFLHWWTDALGPGNNDFMAWAAQTFKDRTGATVEYIEGPTGGGL